MPRPSLLIQPIPSHRSMPPLTNLLRPVRSYKSFDRFDAMVLADPPLIEFKTTGFIHNSPSVSKQITLSIPLADLFSIPS